MQKEEIHVIYGTDPCRMTYEVLTKTNIAAELDPGMHIGLKPNLVVAKKASEGATTSPEVVEGIIQYLSDHGIKNKSKGYISGFSSMRLECVLAIIG